MSRDESMSDERLDSLERTRDAAPTPEAIAAAVIAKLNAERPLSMTGDLHRKHHDFIDTWIKREERRAERWEKIRTQVSGWAIVSALGAVGTAGYHWLIYIRDHLK